MSEIEPTYPETVTAPPFCTTSAVITSFGRYVVNGAIELLKSAAVVVCSTGGCVADVGFGWMEVMLGSRTLSNTCMTPFASNKSDVKIRAELTNHEFDAKVSVTEPPCSVCRVVPLVKFVEKSGPLGLRMTWYDSRSVREVLEREVRVVVTDSMPTLFGARTVMSEVVLRRLARVALGVE